MAAVLRLPLMSTTSPRRWGSCCKPKHLPSRPLIRSLQAPPSRPKGSKEKEEVNIGNKQQQCLKSTGALRLHPEKLDVFKHLEGWAEKNLLPLLRPVEASWQPQDFLPEPSSEGFFERVREVRERAREIPDEYYVCLVGGMVTEEALPTYQSALNTFEGVRDETACSPLPWAVWTRGWSAEENRHGDLLNRYLYLCGRVDMRQVEKTIQYLIGTGMMLPVDNNPYLGFVYTSFQERATFISHGNTARLAKLHGDLVLAKICGTIAADEKRHETAYTRIMAKLFEVDPDAAMLAFATMMRRRITMPAVLMYDGQDDKLFHNYSAVAQHIGVYTASDYADIVEFLVKAWDVEHVAAGLSGAGRAAQEYLCSLSPRIRKVEEKAKERAKLRGSTVPFSWIFNNEVRV
ncbi:hypothetical protein Taro_005509 [Colocasia esculenta]|uniref:Acyl-[acyl-carrier-protein] desaturase n=1 Tax=Colocasia esculenta TaxID=4460 RepID=A0A843TL79_COLES|nr:hypothetical protein [Colocasia esculenta]